MARKRRASLKQWVGLLVAVVSLVGYIGNEYGWFASAQQAAVEYQPGLYTVTRFSDGDTISIDMNGVSETIRLIGVDTPETHDPRKPVQCYGPAASAFTKNYIAGKKIRLQADSKSTNRDRYDRLLRYVYMTDGTLFNEKLIRDGYGFYYPYFAFEKSDSFAAAQAAAQQERKGLWSNCTPTKTDGGGYTSNPQG